MKRDSRTPASYRRDVRGDQKKLLENIRDLVFEIVPDIEERIEYGMLDYPGLANLAAQKNYVSLYVVPKVLARHLRHFEGIDAGKSCLRFRRSDQLDADRVRALLRDVAKERGTL